MHIVHIKDPFTKLDDIKDMADGLAVIGVFLKANEDVDDNEPFQLLLDTISSCRYKGKFCMKSLNLYKPTIFYV